MLNYYNAYNGSDGRPELYVALGTQDATGDDVAQDVVFRQFASIITGKTNGSPGIGSKFIAVVVERSRFKQALFPGGFEFDSYEGADGRVSTGSGDVSFTSAGRKYTGTNYELYPDIGTALITTMQLH